MRTKHGIFAWVSGLALIAFAVGVSGCGAIFETNEAACRRIFNHFDRCAQEAGVSEGVGDFLGIPVSEICAGVSETDGDLSPFADCLTSLSCAQLSGEEPVDDFEMIRCLAALQDR